MWPFSQTGGQPKDGSVVLTISYALDGIREGPRDDEAQALLANRLVRKCLDKSAIQYGEYKVWRRKNPLIFTPIVTQENELIGFFDIFPLTIEASTDILSGKLSERTLSVGHLVPFASSASTPHLHIATILTNPRQRAFSRIVAQELLLLKMGEFIENHYSPIDARTFTAYGQTKHGEALLKRSGFSVALLAKDSDHHWPLYVLRPGETESALLRFEKVGNGLSAMRRGRADLKELDSRIESIELRLRALIASRLGPDPSRLPSHVQQKTEERLQAAARKSGVLTVTQYRRLPERLQFCDIRELFDTMTNKALWPNFQLLFMNKDTLSGKFDEIAELRNRIRHSRTVDEIVLKEGEAGILWFERALAGSYQSTTALE